MDEIIVVYCKQGRRAQDGLNALHELGFHGTKNYFGGIDRWIKA